MGTYLSIDHVGITFGTPKGPLEVLKDVKLDIAEGEFVSLIGHSGCGKSTVLNIVAGLLDATTGGVLLEEREVCEPGPDRAVVFQQHSLLPWLTVYDNVRLAVDQVFGRTKTKKERHDWTRHNLDLVHMGHALDRRPAEISGGMKQRVGIARALAMEPKVLLMDEPFGALDALTRERLQLELWRIWTETRRTVIFITHSVEEAVFLGTRVIVMSPRPGQVVHDQHSPFGPDHPRDRVMRSSPEFTALRQQISQVIDDSAGGHDLPTTA